MQATPAVNLHFKKILHRRRFVMSTLQNFRTYELSIEFYRECRKIKLPHAMRDQLMRASSSITLNLAEGAAKSSRKERLRYYGIAFGSVREIQAIIRLEDLSVLERSVDYLAACLYKLTRQA
jgi:four helix bundle protein